ncbi:MAG: hypothetical protein RLZZ422_1096 [Pseudomonadota bacterium]|jgi:hypothetical protein
MEEKPKTLTIKRKTLVVVKRQEVEPARLAKTKAPPAPPKRKKPSEKHLKILDELLRRKCRVWRDYKPLMNGFRHIMFKIGGEACVHHSKRMVNALYEKHCTDKRYLKNLIDSQYRLDEKGNETDPITAQDKQLAAEKLAKLQSIKR